ncbi:MAG: CotH kinase family protein, partial [Flavobacteriales bacterium]
MAFPDYTAPYLQNEVTTIHVNLSPDSVLAMILNQSDSHFYQAQFIYESSSTLDTLENVGISLRGNTSLIALKKSFKVSFNEFDNGGSWQDVEQLNLVAQQNDPSLLRSALCHSMYRFMDVAAPRTSYTKLYLNNEYFGLYLNQEHIDEEFAKKYFDDQGDGNLYKCTYPADLNYISNDPDDYKFANWGTRHYDLKTNEWLDDYSDLAHFIDVLNNTDLASLECELPEILDVDGYLRAAAVEVLLGHWDSYIYNMNNYYLYHNQLTGQFEFIPYDMDNTLGIDWVGQDWTDRSIYYFAQFSDARPLYKRLLQVESYRDRFSFYIDYLIENYFNEDGIIAQANAWQDLIEPAALEDTYRTLDYGFDNDAFLNAIDEAWGDSHVDFGLSDYVTFRADNALLELDDYATPQPIVSWITQPVT